MTLQQYILDYLKENGSVKVPEFGEFSLKDSAAFFDGPTSTFLPPGKEIFFQVNYENSERKIAEFISEKSGKHFSETTSDLKKLTDYWKKHLTENSELTTEEFGKFFISEDKLLFQGKRLNLSPEENYGLEEINLSQLGKQQILKENPTTSDYKFNKSILWIFLIIIPVGALAFFGITQRDIVFGKDSFKNITVKNATHRIKNDSVKQDSLKSNLLKDSLKTDSIKKNAIAPTKKWTSGKHKYNKWRKPKKRANR